MVVWTISDVVGVSVLTLFMVGAFLYGVALAGRHLLRWAAEQYHGTRRRPK